MQKDGGSAVNQSPEKKRRLDETRKIFKSRYIARLYIAGRKLQLLYPSTKIQSDGPCGSCTWTRDKAQT